MTLSGGTLNPGQSMALSVVLDSSATARAGMYTDTLSFSGTFDNTPGDVSLILHVEEAPDVTYYSFVPVMVGDGGGSNVSGSAEVSVTMRLDRSPE